MEGDLAAGRDLRGRNCGRGAERGVGIGQAERKKAMGADDEVQEPRTMRTFFLLALPALLVLGPVGSAPERIGGKRGMSETTTQLAQARPPRPAPVVSPEVHPDRRVTVRLQAPGAREVQVWGDWGGAPVPLTKDAQGLWSATLGPLPAELYQYGFVVDGLRIPDLANPIGKPQRSPTTSIFEIPGTPPLLSEYQDVPHGTLHRHQYRSGPLRGLRPLVVYTPPGYGTDPDRRYPVLYLLHGSGDNEGAWSVVGRAHLILDNLIAQKKARAMVVVMPDGHITPPFPAAEVGPRALELFEQDLLQEVVPFVEQQYRWRAISSFPSCCDNGASGTSTTRRRGTIAGRSGGSTCPCSSPVCSPRNQGARPTTCGPTQP